MALKPCPDCGAMVSRSAPACPRCGRGLKRSPKQYGCCGLIVAIGGIGFLGLCLAGMLKTAINGPRAAAPVAAVPSSLKPPGTTVRIVGRPYLSVQLCDSEATCREVIDLRTRGRTGDLDELDRSGRAPRVDLPVAAAIIEDHPDLARVRLADGREGWVHKYRIAFE